jgi:hypothetical protein
MAKEPKYSWHLSLRVDRPVEVRFGIEAEVVGVVGQDLPWGGLF